MNAKVDLNKLIRCYMSLCPQCYVWHNAETVQNISRSNCGSSSKFGFYSSENNTKKIDALQSYGSCGAVSIIEPKCSSEGCNCSNFPSTNRSTQCSNCYTQNSRKRKRLYSWQRRNKQKQICSEDRTLTEWSKLNSSNFIVCNILSMGSAAKVNDQANSLEPTADNASLAMNNDGNSSQIKEPYNIDVLSSEKLPSSVFDIRPSTSGVQSTSPQVGFTSYIHLNVSYFPIS